MVGINCEEKFGVCCLGTCWFCRQGLYCGSGGNNCRDYRTVVDVGAVVITVGCKILCKDVQPIKRVHNVVMTSNTATMVPSYPISYIKNDGKKHIGYQPFFGKTGLMNYLVG